jgi:predicted ATPase
LSRHTADAARRASLLGPVLNLRIPDSDFIAPLDPQTRDGLLRSLLLECLRHRASSAPILLVLEDCHWFDPASAALLEFLAHRIGDERVLILLTSRSTFTSAPTSPVLPAGFTEFRLDELRVTDAELLVGLRLRERFPGAASVDSAVVRRIADQGEGNPFYLGELVNYLYANENRSSTSVQSCALLTLSDLHRRAQSVHTCPLVSVRGLAPSLAPSA